MDISDNQPTGSYGERAAVTALVGLIASLLSFLIIGPIIGFVFAMPFFDGNLREMGSMIERPYDYPSFKIPLYIIQGVAALVGLILTPYLFLVIRNEHPRQQFFSSKSTLLAYALTAIVVITFMGFNSFIVEWNAEVSMPESFRAFEEWARVKEDQAALLTEYLTDFDSTGLFIVAFVVIAVIPGIGEELVFRGILQKKLIDSGMNAHLGIWIAAIIFSSIHMQFFGFVPRLLLGALFGYLYLWSGNLKIPILAHFVNNGFMLAMVYQHQLGTTDINIEEPDSTPLATAVILSIITLVILIFLYRYWNKKPADGAMAEGI